MKKSELTNLQLAGLMAKNSVNYEMSDWHVMWDISHSYGIGECYYIALENGENEILIKVSNINVDDDADLSNPIDTDWIWGAEFEIRHCEDNYWPINFWVSDVKHLWIVVLSDDGWNLK